MKAVIFGSTGLVGSALQKLIGEQNIYGQVVLYVRNKSAFSEINFIEKVIDFNLFNIDPEDFENADVFCCIGTTIRNVHYDKEVFKKIDLEIPLKIANACKEFNAKNLLVVSSMGASTTSKFFYSQVKGMLEEKLNELQLSSLHILRPSLLLGNRKDYRIGEKLSQFIFPLLSPLLIGQFKSYRPIKARSVAKAMYMIAQKNHLGNHLYDCEQIRKIAQ